MREPTYHTSGVHAGRFAEGGPQAGRLGDLAPP